MIEPGETVLLPAVVGLARPAEAWDDLQERLGAPVAEVPTIPPSVPGIRLEGLLVAALRAAGGELVLGPDAVGVEGARGRATGVLVHRAARRAPSPPTRWCSPLAGSRRAASTSTPTATSARPWPGCPLPARRRAIPAFRRGRSTRSR